MSKEVIKNRYDFVALFDCKNGNPNGDPDLSNLPRTDPISGHGYVTDVCIKRKIRNEVALRHEADDGYKMYIQGDTTLNAKDEMAFAALGADRKTAADLKKSNPEANKLLREFMCKNFYDVRTFGGVMTSFNSAGFDAAVRGPVQISFATSISPVDVRDLTISRQAVATEAEREKHNGTLGNKAVIAYGLYRFTGSVDANLAQKSTGFSEDDLEALWEGIEYMFMHDKAAARPEMVLRKLVIFKHDSIYGNAHDYQLYDRVSALEKTPGVIPQSFDDYVIAVNQDDMPKGVECIVRV